MCCIPVGTPEGASVSLRASARAVLVEGILGFLRAVSRESANTHPLVNLLTNSWILRFTVPTRNCASSLNKAFILSPRNATLWSRFTCQGKPRVKSNLLFSSCSRIHDSATLSNSRVFATVHCLLCVRSQRILSPFTVLSGPSRSFTLH